MATSGNTAFTSTRDKIIRKAALLVGAIGAGVTPNATLTSDFAYSLNGMVKRWQAKGIHIWTVTEATLFIQPGQTQYRLGTGTTDHITASWNETALSAEEASGQTTLSVDDTTDMVVADKIAVTLDDGTLHWSTISSKTSSTVTIADALTDSAAEAAKVFFYTTDLARPLKIVDARRYNVTDGSETPIMMVARRDYHAIPQKTAAGSMNQAFYDRQLANGYLHLWPVPETATEFCKFTCHRPIETFETGGNNPDLPEEWVQVIEYNLAVVMAPEFDVPDSKFRKLAALAEQFLDDMQGYDREDESIFMQPDIG